MQSQRNQADNSIQFKHTLDSLLMKSQTPGMFQQASQNQQKRTKKPSNQQSEQNTQQIVAPKKPDPLNEWSYCNPENQKDPLPQPFRFINKCLQELVLKQVYQQIFDIEKHKNNPNYEGNVLEQPPQGNFDINGISCLTKGHSLTNQMIAGDKFGNICVLDMNKKILLNKIQAIEAKRIIHLDSITFSYADQYLTTIAVIARAHNEVLIYRFLSSENVLHHHFKIKITEEYNEESTIDQFPRQAQISSDGDFIKISNYRGDIMIYRIPEPPAPVLEQQQQDEGQNLLNPNYQQGFTEKAQVQIQKLATMNFELEVQEITEQFFKLEFEGQPKNFNYDQYLKSLQEQSKNQYKEQEPVDPKAAGKDAKKDAKKGGKAQTLETEEQEKEDLLQEEIEFNENIVFPKYEYTEELGDISEEIPTPKFIPYSYFTQSALTVVNTERLFGKTKTVHLTTGLFVAWSNTKKLYNYQLQPAKEEYLNEYTYSIYFSDPLYTNKQKVLRDALVFMPPKLLKQIDVLYSISTVSISTEKTMLGVGMKNGTILIWDMLLQCEKWYLDKHLQKVTSIQFFEDYKLVSGSEDGGVHIYNLEKGKMEMKRTNLFNQKKEYSVLDIKISSIGVAFVLDSLNNLRLYDIYHGEKIARMNLKTIMTDSTPKGYKLTPYPIMDTQKEQLSIVCEINKNNNFDISNEIDKDNENENNKHANNPWVQQTNLQMFKVHEAFLNLFPGYSNVYNKMGLNMEKKHQIINIFGRLTLEQLKNPDFELPTIGNQGQNHENQSIVLKPPSISRKSQASRFKTNKSSIMKNSRVSMNQSNTGSQNLSGLYTKQQSTIQNNNYPKVQKSSIKRLDSQNSFQNQGNQSMSEITEIDLNSSFKTQMTQISGPMKLGGTQQIGKTNKGLTKEILHPEQALLSKIQLSHEEKIDVAQKAINSSRKINQASAQRKHYLDKKMQRIKNELSIRDERLLLDKKKQLLQK